MHRPIQITRRAACQAMAAGLGACSAAARGAEQRRGVPGEYLLASAMYGTLPLQEVVAEVRKTGAGHIDLWRRPHANHWEQVGKLGEDAFTALLKEHNVQFGAVTFWNGDFENSLRFAGRHVGEIVVTGFVPKTGGLKAYLRKIEPQVALAEELNVTLAIENHGCGFDDIRRFAEAAKSTRLGVALAPYHLPQDANQLAQLITDLGPKLSLFYAWQHGMGCRKKLPKEQELLQMPGRGKLDFGPLVEALHKINYKGFVEIFMHPVPRGIPILPTAEEVTAEINRGRKYLESVG
jgi:sugar phosphate isomerase/epimerase